MKIYDKEDAIEIWSGSDKISVPKNNISSLSLNYSQAKVVLSRFNDDSIDCKVCDITEPSVEDVSELWDYLNEYIYSDVKYKTIVVTHEIDGEDADIYLGDFGDYDQVSVDILYEGLDDVDAVIYLQQAGQAMNHVDIPGLNLALDDPTGTGFDILQDDSWGGKYLYAFLDVGSVSEGDLTFTITVKQH